MSEPSPRHPSPPPAPDSPPKTPDPPAKEQPDQQADGQADLGADWQALLDAVAGGDLRVVITSASGRTAVLVSEEELVRLERRAVESTVSPMLTDREKEALRWVERSGSTVEVAQAMGVALGTAVAHLASARRKCGVRTSAQAAARAREAGELS